MKLLETTMTNLTLCGFRRNQTHLFNMNHLISLIAFLSHLTFFFCEADNIIEYVNAAYFTTASLGIFISFTNSIYKATTIFKFVDYLQNLVDKRLKYSKPKKIYIETHRIVEKVSKIMNFVIVKITSFGFIIPKAVVCVFIYITTDMGSEAFESPLPAWFPFDWRNLTGYLMAVVLQFIMLLFINVYLACFLCLAFAIFLFTHSIAKDMINELRSFNKHIKMKKSKAQLLKQLNEFISMHADVKDITNNFTEAYQTTIAVLFSGSIVAICMALLMFQLELTSDEVDTVVFLESVLCGFWAFVMVFFACEIGQRFSNAYEEIDNVIDQMNWNYLPMEIQQTLPIIMINTQQPSFIKCFGSMVCSRETFKKVSNSGYTFFMVLRKFYN